MQKSREEWQQLWDRCPGEAFDKTLYLLGIYCGAIVSLGNHAISMGNPSLGSFLMFKWNTSHAPEVRAIYRKYSSSSEKNLDALIEELGDRIPPLRIGKGDMYYLMYVIKDNYFQMEAMRLALLLVQN